jgi:RNA recognition motif-containing protein
MLRFGEIEKVKIPYEELRNGSKRRRNFAFVTFINKTAATRAVEEGEVNVEFSTLKIERALERVR